VLGTVLAEASAGWFLTHAWIVPIVPAVGFALELLLGKRTGRWTSNGAYFGVASLFIALVLSLGVAVNWISRTNDAKSAETTSALVAPGAAPGHALVRPLAAEEGGGGAASEAAGGEHEELGTRATPVDRTWTWWQSGGVIFSIGQHVDGLAVTLLVVVTFISFLIHLYSLEYVRDDRRYTHFFASLTLFTAAMLNMVIAENMLQLLLGWEVMGLTSFMLIGHWWEDEANSRAALKAFFTTRTGDVGLLVGISIMFFATGTFSIQGINEAALSGKVDSTVLLVGAIALFIACIGKSGQFPLHTWLPDAMAGPTPVSALLHSSTMVVAGVYLVARLYGVFYQGFDIAGGGMNLIIVIAAITIIISGFLACVQRDIKKVLAYSTVGQLAYMMLGLGGGAWTMAVFHIFTHAFFKALLFLCAGSVSHSGSHHSFDMVADMGGLRKRMPVTFWTWMIGTVSLAGIIPFAGFWSKDEILANVGENGFTAFMVVGLIGAFFTAAYMGRATYLTFFGEPRGAAAMAHHDEHGEEHELDVPLAVAATHDVPPADHAGVALATTHGHDAHTGHDTGHGHDAAHDAGHGHAGPHESPWLITLPLVALTVVSIASGFLNAVPFFHIETFTHWVEPAGQAYFPSLGHAPVDYGKVALSVAIAVVGLLVGLALYAYAYGPFRDLTRRFAPARWGYLFLVNRYYLDALYEKVIVRAIAHPIAQAAYWVNQHVIDGVVNVAGRVSALAGRLVYRYIDQGVVDGVVNGAGATATGSGEGLKGIQSGRVQQYGALLFGAASVAALALVVYIRAK
jgi:NADH-quinone oxidoreductase subunit L